MKGADATGDDLKLLPNRTDTYSFIQLFGNDDIRFAVASGKDYDLYVAADLVWRLDGGGGNYGFYFREASSSPSALNNFGCIYTKSDNKLYFRDGAGTEHEVAFV